MTPLSNAERQQRYRKRHRERLREERTARRARADARSLLAVGPDPACSCCGEAFVDFLTLRNGKVYCRNCAHVLDAGGLCPHQGISGRLG